MHMKNDKQFTVKLRLTKMAKFLSSAAHNYETPNFTTFIIYHIPFAHYSNHIMTKTSEFRKKTVDDVAYWDAVEKLRLANKPTITYANWKKQQAAKVKLMLKKSIIRKSKHGNHYMFLFKPFLQYATHYLKLKKQTIDPSDALLLFLKKQHKNGKYFSTKTNKFIRFKYKAN